jgi:hypothetical protein
MGGTAPRPGSSQNPAQDPGQRRRPGPDDVVQGEVID